MLIPTLLQVATRLLGPASKQHHYQSLQNDVNSAVNAAVSDNSHNIINYPRVPGPIPDPAPAPDPVPTLYTSWVPNGQYSVGGPPPPVAPVAPAPPVAPVAPPVPLPAPAAPTTAWPQQPSPLAPQAAPPGPPAPAQTWSPAPPAAIPSQPHPGAPPPPVAAPPGAVPPAPPAPPGGIVVGGVATVVLSPDKTVIVENPAITLPPHGGPPDAGAAAAMAWTSVPPGWYATTYYACQGQGCAWHISIRPLSDSGGHRNSVMGRHLGAMAFYGMLTAVMVLVVR